MHYVRPLLAALVAMSAYALDIQPYSPDALSKAQAAGKPVALHFRADWCPTCRAQDKALNSLKADKDLNIAILDVDYDKEKALEKKLGVETQSTFIVYKGNAEKGRIAGETTPDKIKAALKTAL
ncbi:MAG: thioredoxin family protein [Burkholderiales bacterium]|nr:thioredoxin family protein [Burkholderiales bacterium]